jgi:hypothetical protein
MWQRHNAQLANFDVTTFGVAVSAKDSWTLHPRAAEDCTAEIFARCY